MDDKIEVTKDQFFMLILLYNSKYSEILRKTLCDVIKITETNFATYKQFIGLLKENSILRFSYLKGRSIKIILDRKKLEELIRKTDYYKLTDDFIHKSTFGMAYTG